MSSKTVVIIAIIFYNLNKSIQQKLNPCPIPIGDPIHCTSRTNETTTGFLKFDCPSGYWCHLGSTWSKTVCCPQAGDPCVQQKAFGSGKESLPRYYYNSDTGYCQLFVYKGLQGNQNNFMSRKDCELACRNDMQVCSGRAYISPSGTPLHCSPVRGILSSCPETFYCHVGPTVDSTLCCSKTGIHPCSMLPVYGDGSAILPRWYYYAPGKTCRQFTYSGARGNENNFLSRKDCEEKCLPDGINDNGLIRPLDQPTEPEIVCISGSLSLSCSSDKSCPTGAWCHHGPTERDNVCCRGMSDPCQTPVSEGVGVHNLPRWYFNRRSRQCEFFFYYGKQGNANNFLSKADCETTCIANIMGTRSPCLNSMTTQMTSNIRHQNCVDQGCPRGYWCHLGGSYETTVCCPVQNSISPCMQPPAPGTGNLHLTRWFFNSATGNSCNTFTYHGLNGNQNNFISRQACEADCLISSSSIPEQPIIGVGVENPCAVGTALINDDGGNFTCDPTSYSATSSCPIGFFCHLGTKPETTICCLRASFNPCEEPTATGEGTSDVLRWHYNSHTKECQSFAFKGLKGNANNFLSEESCQAGCMRDVFPCIHSNLLHDDHGSAVSCQPGSCPRGYWCHVGGDAATTICCEGDADPCTMEMSVGAGQFRLQRFFYNPVAKLCDQFTYKGAGGNQNNFLSLEACQRKCIFGKSSCPIGQPILTANGVPQSCSDSFTCPRNYWCHVGENKSSTVCCRSADQPCHLPLAEGTGKAQLRRWYFNTDLQRCIVFTYRGMRGNQNNFLTKEQCDSACLPSQENIQSDNGPCPTESPIVNVNGSNIECLPIGGQCPDGSWCHLGADQETTICCLNAGSSCQLPIQPGVGSSQLYRWAYNSTQQACTSFIYLGLKGNQNNFVTLEECESECISNLHSNTPCPGSSNQNDGRNAQLCLTDNDCSYDQWCHIGLSNELSVCCDNASSNTCLLPKSNGIGIARLNRWYFDPWTQTCKSFIYRGAKGNQNNFLSSTECYHNCR